MKKVGATTISKLRYFNRQKLGKITERIERVIPYYTYAKYHDNVYYPMLKMIRLIEDGRELETQADLDHIKEQLGMDYGSDYL